MGDILSAISGTPVPTILVIGGMFFILLAIAGQIASQISIPPERRGTILLIGIILLVIGTLLYLIPNVMVAKNPAPTGTPEVTLTEDESAGQSVPDPAESLPTVEENPQSRNQCEVLLDDSESWPVLVEDNFNVNQIQWLETDEEYPQLNVSKHIENGRYNWTLKTTVDAWVHYAMPTLDPLENFYLAVDIDYIDESQYLQAGLIFRKQGDAYYTFGVSQPIPEYSLFQYDGTSWTTLIGFTRVSAFEPGTRNTLAVIADGDRYCFFVNDKYVGTQQDDALSFGNAGVFLSTFTRDYEYNLSYDNFVIKEKP